MQIRVPSLNEELFKTLMKNIYVNPKLAVIREVLTNALDSHKEIGLEDKVSLVIDKQFITIRDRGLSFSDSKMENVFGELFSSTKKGSVETDGEHGIGSKTPYGYLYDAPIPYADRFFTMTTRRRGTKTFYIMGFTDGNIPFYEKVYSSPCDETDNGTEVRIPNLFNESDVIGTFLRALIPIRDKVDLSGDSGLVPLIKKGLERVCLITPDWSHSPDLSKDLGTSDIVWVHFKNILYPVSRSYLRKGYVRDTVENIIEDGGNIFKIDPHTDIKPNRARDRFDLQDSSPDALTPLVLAMQSYKDILLKVEDTYRDKLTNDYGSYQKTIHNRLMKAIGFPEDTYMGYSTGHANPDHNEKLDISNIHRSFEEVAMPIELLLRDGGFDMTSLSSALVKSDLRGKFLILLHKSHIVCPIRDMIQNLPSCVEVTNVEFGCAFNPLDDSGSGIHIVDKKYTVIKNTESAQFVGVLTRKTSDLDKFYIILRDQRAFKGPLSKFLEDVTTKDYRPELIVVDYSDNNKAEVDSLLDTAFKNTIKVSDLAEKYKGKIKKDKASKKQSSTPTNEMRTRRIKGFELFGVGNHYGNFTDAIGESKKTIKGDAFLNFMERHAGKVYYADLSDISRSFWSKDMIFFTSHYDNFNEKVVIYRESSEVSLLLSDFACTIFGEGEGGLVVIFNREVKAEDRQYVMERGEPLMDRLVNKISTIDMRHRLYSFDKVALKHHISLKGSVTRHSEIVNNMTVHIELKSSKDETPWSPVNAALKPLRVVELSVDLERVIDIITSVLEKDTFWATTLHHVLRFAYSTSPETTVVLERFLKEHNLENEFEFIT